MSDKTRWRTLYHFEFAHTPEKSIPIIGIMRQRFFRRGQSSGLDFPGAMIMSAPINGMGWG
ncbi:hypothetical protein ACFYE9_14990 [Rhizobium leguminosarum]|uniref:Uncharacterized protein n=1 Tax=Rhizobium leguminosarum TaxID=384 RepID=A0ACD5F862_RHILE|nr:hypothetical protein [Rhizobium leguminosarum]